MKKFSYMFLIIVLFGIIGCSGCATLGFNQSMTDKQQGLVFEALYKSAFLSTKATLENKAALPEETAIARQKQKILEEVYPLLKDFLAPVDISKPKGDIIGYKMSEAKLQRFIQLIDELSKLVMTGGK